jgi:hypothetical protein
LQQCWVLLTFLREHSGYLKGLEEKQFDFSKSDTLIGFQIMIKMRLLAFQVKV